MDAALHRRRGRVARACPVGPPRRLVAVHQLAELRAGGGAVPRRVRLPAAALPQLPAPLAASALAQRVRDEPVRALGWRTWSLRGIAAGPSPQEIGRASC